MRYRCDAVWVTSGVRALGVAGWRDGRRCEGVRASGLARTPPDLGAQDAVQPETPLHLQSETKRMAIRAKRIAKRV